MIGLPRLIEAKLLFYQVELADAGMLLDYLVASQWWPVVEEHVVLVELWLVEVVVVLRGLHAEGAAVVVRRLAYLLLVVKGTSLMVSILGLLLVLIGLPVGRVSFVVLFH